VRRDVGGLESSGKKYIWRCVKLKREREREREREFLSFHKDNKLCNCYAGASRRITRGEGSEQERKVKTGERE